MFLKPSTVAGFLVDYWQLINNSGNTPVLIEEGKNP